jgi:putative holliday junction resolvase
MKIMALDLGDAWVGTALTDPLRFFCKPYKTVAADQLETFLQETFSKEKVSIVVVGYPKTMQGTESDQTKLVVATKEKLEQMFPAQQWVLWDERLSSKQARSMKNPKNKSEKLEQHSIAAAIILQSYLPYLAAQ